MSVVIPLYMQESWHWVLRRFRGSGPVSDLDARDLTMRVVAIGRS